MAALAPRKRHPGSLAERFWSLAHSAGPLGEPSGARRVACPEAVPRGLPVDDRRAERSEARSLPRGRAEGLARWIDGEPSGARRGACPEAVPRGLPGWIDGDSTDPEPQAVVRHVLKILDGLAAGEVGDGVSQCSLSFLALLRQHEALGDLSYASPEQARGENLDERSLVFSVGVLLFEELTGRHPFGKETARRFARIKKGEMGSGVQYFPQVPTALRGVLVQAMGPFPEERFASLAELRAALEAFAAPRKPADDDRTRPFSRRPVMLAPGIHLPADAFATTLPAAQAARPPLPAPLPRPVVSPLLSTPLMPPLPRRHRLRAVAERLGWLALGVVATIGTTRLLSHAGPRPPQAAQAVAAAPAAKAAPDPLEAPAPAEVVPQPPASFDGMQAAQAAAQASRACFERVDHTVAFGLGLLFAGGDAGIHKVYLAPDELSPEARRCLVKTLPGVSAAAAPEKGLVVEARVRLRPDGSNEVKVK